MLQRLTESESSLQDHEALEMLLFNAIPRRNTNPIAHVLLETFGSLSGVLHAPVEELKTVKGVGEETACYLRIVGHFMDRVKCAEENYPAKFTLEAFSAYLIKRLRPLKEEYIEVFCFDKNERVKSSKRFTSYRNDGVAVKTEEINRYLVTAHPHGVLVAHNHPSASCAPSEEDDAFTEQLVLLCSITNLKIYDHIIVGSDSTYSYFRMGKLEKISAKCNVHTMLKGVGNP